MAWIEGGFWIKVDQSADVTVLTIRGELDLATAPRVTAECSELAERGAAQVLVDAREITFIDATGVDAFIQARSTLHEHGCSFNIIPSRQVRRIFDLLGLDGEFPIFSSTEEAVSRLEGSSHE